MAGILDERDFAHVGADMGGKTASLRGDDVLASAEFRKMYETLPNVVSAAAQPTWPGQY